MAEDSGQIIVRLGPEIERTVSLDSPVLTIGRAPDATISLQRPVISRQHAELRLEPEGLVLTDVGSSNGTYIDGERIAPHQPQLLTSGSSFQIGPYILTYREAGSDISLDDAPAVESGNEEGTAPDVSQRVPLGRMQPVVPPRPTYPLPVPAGPRSSYLRDLPDIYQENDFLGRFLLIFETIWEPIEQRQDHIATYFDPHTAPRSFLAWLGGWLDLAIDPHWPESRSRDLLAEAMDLYRWRGTSYGLARLIEVSTGGIVDISEDPSRPFVFEVRVVVPAGDEISDELIRRLIQSSKPAHTGYVLEVVRS